MHVQLNPLGAMDLLSQLEVDQLKQNANSETFRLFRNCCLAVLNVGSHTDSSAEIYQQFENFTVNLIARERGIKIELFNPPASAFVDELVTGIVIGSSWCLCSIMKILCPWCRSEWQTNGLADPSDLPESAPSPWACRPESPLLFGPEWQR